VVRSSRNRGPLPAIAVVAVAALGLITPIESTAASEPAAASAPSPSLPSDGSGIDVSFPQCIPHSHIELPTDGPFAVVGVNGGIASNSNPCFLSEYNSALLLSGSTEQPHVAVYVNTGNPALAATWWPSDDKTETGTAIENPDGSCTGEAGAACAYIYGYSMAQADYRRVRTTLSRLPTMWWLDVETTNTWQPDVVANAASLTGMVDYFQSEDLDVGLYSTPYQWNRIAGVTGSASHLAGLPSWLAGGSYAGAPLDCEKSALTPGGRVAMVQYVSILDHDYSCHQFGVVAATIASNNQPEGVVRSVAGTRLTSIVGRWGPGDVTYSYQWNRDGTAIPGANSSAYVPTESDVGSYVTVTVTGSESGFSTVSETSSGVAIFEALQPV
jgi:hypothetical protein